MKKLLIVVLAAALCLGMLATVGCDGENSQAKTYMEKGDELSRQMRSFTSDSAFDVAALLAELGIQVSETGTIKSKTVTDAATKKLDTIIANGVEAKAEYEKILLLDGAEPYKEYAKKRIDAIDSTIVVLRALNTLLTELGDPSNTKSVGSTLADWAKANVSVAVEAVKAYTRWRDAEEIRKKNKLGPIEEVPESSAPESSTGSESSAE